MSSPPVSRAYVVVTAVLGVAMLTRGASAQPCAAPADCPATTAPPVPQATDALRVSVVAHEFAFDRAKLRASLSRELARPVVFVERANADVQVELQGAARVSMTTPSAAAATT